MTVPLFLETIEQTSFSTWLRESDSIFGFYFILALHTLGLAMLVGPNAAIDLRLLGFGRGIPLAPLKRWFKIMWLGFGLNAVTGALLFWAYPTKAATNLDFYIKLGLIGVAVWILLKLKKRVFGDATLSEAAMETSGRTLAMWSLVFWMGAITMGRLLAYTYTWILFGQYSPGG